MSITAYPLTWPTGWKRTPAASRREARFGKARQSQGNDRGGRGNGSGGGRDEQRNTRGSGNGGSGPRSNVGYGNGGGGGGRGQQPKHGGGYDDMNDDIPY